jgi:hypothetical protein
VYAAGMPASLPALNGGTCSGLQGIPHGQIDIQSAERVMSSVPDGSCLYVYVVTGDGSIPYIRRFQGRLCYGSVNLEA